MLLLPQPNNSQVKIPNVPNYRRILEAYGFNVVRREPTILLMARNFPDSNMFDGAWQARAEVPPEIENAIQRAIQVVK